MSATSPNINTQVYSNIPKNFFPDHIYEDHPTLMRLIEKGDKQDGGLNWAPNRIATKDATSTWFAGTSLSAVISSASQTSALLNETYVWKNIITPITLTYDERQFHHRQGVVFRQARRVHFRGVGSD